MTTHASLTPRPSLLASRAGWSLLELLAVLALLSVFMVLIVAGLAGALRTEKAGAVAFQKLAAQSALADRFRADVAAARAAPAKLDTFVGGPDCLILDAGQGSHIVYRWEKDRLTRTVLSGNGKTEQRFPLGEKGAVEFARSAASPHTLLTLRIKSRLMPEWTAVLGGDNR